MNYDDIMKNRKDCLITFSGGDLHDLDGISLYERLIINCTGKTYTNSSREGSDVTGHLT